MKPGPTPSLMDLSTDVQYAWDAQGAPTESQLQAWTSAAAADRSGEAEMTVRIVDEKEGAELNRQYRGGDGATNVLSFSFEAPPGVTHPLLGDVVVCGPVVMREAHEQAKIPEAHWAHMVVHGTLHLLGFDHQHEAEAKRMESRELFVLSLFGFSDPYCNSSLP